MAGYHRKARAPRSWWQVIIPVITLGALLSTGIVALIYYHSGKAVAAPVRVVAPKAVQVYPPPSGEPAPHLGAVRYRVHPGDSWWSIAVKFCPSGNSYAHLADANHAPLGVLPLGKVITVTC